MTALVVDRLTKTYSNGVSALSEVSLEIGCGLFGLLGPNGAGKSTLMRTLATLQLPDSGTARLDETDLINSPHAARQRLGYLPQEVGVYPKVTAREMLRYIAGLKGLCRGGGTRRLVEQQLDRVNLLPVADQRLDTFSGGMRQRFGIAAAFLGDPKLVIVDEPTAGLDPYERRRFQLLLTEAARDCVLILSSHIVEDLAGLCGSIAVMDGGRLVAIGSPEGLVARLDGAVWQASVGLDQLAECQAQHRVLAWQPVQSRLRVRVWADRRPDQVAGSQVEAVKPDLEDLYAFLVNRED
ncbi:MAG: ATP-binding cassette domain-containing protein [Planctomycetota bacterium]